MPLYFLIYERIDRDAYKIAGKIQLLGQTCSIFSFGWQSLLFTQSDFHAMCIFYIMWLIYTKYLKCVKQSFFFVFSEF